MNATTTDMWLDETETALVLALEACRLAREDANDPVSTDGVRGDLAVALTVLDHHVGVARGTTRAAMRVAGDA